MRKKAETLWSSLEIKKTLDENIAEAVNAIWEKAYDYDVWDIGYSGGKDSTTLVTLMAYLIKNKRILPPKKKIIVHYADTGMEVPPLQKAAYRILEQVQEYGFETKIVHPALDDRFFVNMFGRGVSLPNNGRMRWCTRVLKAKPMFAEMMPLREHDKICLFTGVRDGESQVRDGRIVAACSSDGGECGQGYMHVKYQEKSKDDPLAILLGWRLCNIQDWLTLYAPNKQYGGFATEAIAEIYGFDRLDNEEQMEEPISARTGCMECPLVTNPKGEPKPDKMMERILEIPKYAYLAPVRRLLDVYVELTKDCYHLQKDGTHRLKNGGMPKNPYRKGPLTMEARLWGLSQVKSIQDEVNILAATCNGDPISLISAEEEARILDLIALNTWPRDWNGMEPLASEFKVPEVKTLTRQLQMFQPKHEEYKEDIA